VLNNEEARVLYEQHRTWKGPPRHLSLGGFLEKEEK